MRNLPQGRLTLLFTDIEGSTEMVKLLGPAYAQVQDTHRKILRAAFAMHSGYEVDTQGDAFFYVFESAGEAVAATVAGQRALARHGWPSQIGELKVRMALHTGEPTPTSEGYIGLDVNRAARIGGVGHGGQVLLSATTVAEATSELPEGVALEDLGRHWLKDLAAPEALQRLVIEGLVDVDRAPSSLSSPGLEQRIRVGDADSDAADADGLSAPERDLPDLLEALRRTVVDERAGIRLSATELDRIVRHAPADLDAYRLARVAEWSQPRYGLDERFVGLTLLLDPEGEGEQVGWAAQPSQHQDLGAALEAASSPVLMLLGPPGSGKSTLLRQFELSLALRSLLDSGDAGGPTSTTTSTSAKATATAGLAADRSMLSWFVPLNAFRDAALRPADWLAERWRQHQPDLPTFDELLEEGRLLLLLDALNELPASSETERRRRTAEWRDFAKDAARRNAGNRIVFSCRTLDYSSPLSSPELPVPRLRIEPMDDVQVQRFLGLHCPGIAGGIWQQLAGTPTLELLRAPFFLALMVEQILESGGIPRGRAGLFTDFVRRAIQREVQRENPLFMPDGLLSTRDHRRLLAARTSGTPATPRGERQRDRGRVRPFALPDRGLLLPQLQVLAHSMQAQESASPQKQVRIDFEDALDLLDPERGEDVLAAGIALSVLEEDLERDEILFSHPLLQEYFAARQMAGRARSDEGDARLDVLAAAWRIEDIEPTLREALDATRAAEPMPALPSTGWEESAKMAAAMARDPETFVSALMPVNLALAGECAIQAEMDPKQVEGVIDALRRSLLNRAEDQEADLRARIQAARVLAEIGDPRLPQRDGREGAYLEPAMLEVPAGTYPMGDDVAPARPDESPRHEVEIAGFEVSRFPVTNAEWAAFMKAGGYEDERWWPSGPAADWRIGRGSMDGQKQNWRQWWKRFRSDPEQLEALAARGALSEDQAAEWRAHVALDEAAFETVLSAYFPEQRYTEPRAWQQRAFNHPSQPVIGISLFEALAFCRWLSATSGRGYRLPSEAEWAAAARGPSGRRYAWGETFDPLRGNVGPTRSRATTPVGVFPEGQSARGVDDLSGNCFEWTASLYGPEDGQPDFGYPYRAEDGREDEAAPAQILRVARGGSWADGPDTARCAYRYPLHPALRHITVGFRLVRDVGSEGSGSRAD